MHRRAQIEICSWWILYLAFILSAVHSSVGNDLERIGFSVLRTTGFYALDLGSIAYSIFFPSSSSRTSGCFLFFRKILRSGQFLE